jgi:molybdopterin-guanine dinucleotide biosynthesis protein A
MVDTPYGLRQQSCRLRPGLQPGRNAQALLAHSKRVQFIRLPGIEEWNFEMNLANEMVSGFVLAGGKSSRFPPNKALASFRGSPLLVNALRILSSITPSLFILGPPASFASSGVPIIPDLGESCGPITGLYTAIKRSASSVNLILACDMPLLTPDFFRELLKRVPPAEAAVFRHADGKVEPLAGVYGKACLPKIESFLLAGGRKVAELLLALQVSYVEEKDFSECVIRPDMLANLNSPEDLVRLESIVG